MTNQPVMSAAQEFIFQRTYSRWRDDLGRRETWGEAVDRYFKFMKGKFSNRVPDKVWKKTYEAFLSMGVMPSMRAFWAAGPALERNSLCGYNCSALAVKDLQSFSEIFYLLMCGTGVGFTVEKAFISKLPPVKVQEKDYVPSTFVVPDDKEGWADSIRLLMEALFDGRDLDMEYHLIRPAGARLMTMGGRASGPEPLMALHREIRHIVKGAQGRQLTDLECSDIGNHIGVAVVVGGVRRSSEITFSDLDSNAMRHAKDFPIPDHRYMSNNTVAYKSKPTMIQFMEEWLNLAKSGSGERGMYNQQAAAKASSRRFTRAEYEKYVGPLPQWLLELIGDQDFDQFLRTNPCGEILLNILFGQLCNLSEIVVRAEDDLETLTEKVKSAVWLGAMQACLTDFKYVRSDFKFICDQERLLGVSITGQMDNPELMTAANLKHLKKIALKECKKACDALGINMSTAITTGKPSGTVSQLNNCSSGAHPRFAKYYIRRYRIAATDPLFHMMAAQGIKFTPENGQGRQDVNLKRKALREKGLSDEQIDTQVPYWSPEKVLTWVCAFPEKAPENCLTRHDVSAIEQLEWYLKLTKNWAEHNQSITVYVRDNEWMQVGNWVYAHFDELVAVSFLPYDGGGYQQAPYEEISRQDYELLEEAMPKIDYSQLSKFELDDNTVGAQTLACSGSSCESR